MGRKGIQASDVVRAYIALRQQKREPTLLNLRLELGQGSYSTIARHLKGLGLRYPATLNIATSKSGRPHVTDLSFD